MKYNLDIPGWMTPTDLTVLNTIASYVPENGSILEVGSFVGSSTCALFYGKSATVHLEVVDTFEVNNSYNTNIPASVFHSGSAEYISKINSLAKETGSWLESFKYCLTPEIANQITINVISSREYCPPRKFDMAFIDASHSEKDVLIDILKYHSTDTLLVGDDYNHRWPGIAQAVCKYRRHFPRKLIIPANSKIWIMVPSTGYWHEVFQKNNLF